MPDRCICGSDLTMNECCLSIGIAEMKRIALDRSVNRDRIRWASNYFEYKTMINDMILEEQDAYVKSVGREITCSEGCSMCCVEFIAARLEECDAIAMYLYVNPTLMNTFLKNYEPWYERLSSGDNILEKTAVSYRRLFETRSPENRTLVEGLLPDYAKRYAQCPFLEDNRCLIYPIRPFGCSTYCVLSDKTFCDPAVHERSPGSRLKLKSARNPLTFHHSYHVGLQGRRILGAMPRMVHDILVHGPLFFGDPKLS